MNTLREKRVQAGLSMNQVSRMTGVSKTALSLYENGHRDLSVKRARVLAKAYGCSWEELYGDDEDDGTANVS